MVFLLIFLEINNYNLYKGTYDMVDVVWKSGSYIKVEEGG